MKVRALKAAINTIEAHWLIVVLATFLGKKTLVDDAIVRTWRGKDYFMEKTTTKEQ